MISSRSFMVSGLMFKSLIHFEFVFVYGVRKLSSLICLHVTVQFSQYHLLKRLSFLSSVYSCLLCYRLIDHISVGLFGGFLFCSIDLCVWFYTTIILLCLLQLLVQFEIRVHDPLSFVLFFKIVLAIWGLLWLQTNLRTMFSSSVKNAIEILIEIALNLKISLGSIVIFINSQILNSSKKSIVNLLFPLRTFPVRALVNLNAKIYSENWHSAYILK